MEDSQIVALFRARSEDAITQLARKYRRLLHTVALNILGSRRDAEECVSDAYLAVWNTVPPQDPDPLAAYACRVTRNLALKRRAANTARKRRSDGDAALDELEYCIPGPDTPESALDAQLLRQALERFLDGLDVKNRVVFVRRYWFGDSLDAIARHMGMTRHTVAVRLARLREKLRKFLESEDIAL